MGTVPSTRLADRSTVQVASGQLTSTSESNRVRLTREMIGLVE